MNNILASKEYKIPYFASDKKGKYKTKQPLSENQIIKAATAILKSRVAQKGYTMSSSEDTRQLMMTHLANCSNEVFVCLFLDNKHRVLSMEETFYGTIDGTTIYPRVVVKRALELNAAAMIIVHNHPSGTSKPSLNDIQITKILDDALNLVGIRLLDHIIVGGGECSSLAELGEL